METFLSLPGISIPNLSETLRLARIALTAEEFDEWIASRAKDKPEPQTLEEAA
jgi:hypothetical protein